MLFRLFKMIHFPLLMIDHDCLETKHPGWNIEFGPKGFMVCSKCNSSSFSFNCLWGMLVYSLLGAQTSRSAQPYLKIVRFLSTCFKLFNESFISHLSDNSLILQCCHVLHFFSLLIEASTKRSEV